MRTSPAAGLGISRSTISKSPPGLEICADFIGVTAILVVAMMPPSDRCSGNLKLRREEKRPGGRVLCRFEVLVLMRAGFGWKQKAQHKLNLPRSLPYRANSTRR